MHLKFCFYVLLWFKNIKVIILILRLHLHNNIIWKDLGLSKSGSATQI